MEIQTSNILTINETFERFLRLSVADGSASPRTVEAYKAGFNFYARWCQNIGCNPRLATFDDLQEYRKWLQTNYKRATAKLRFVAVRALYKALQRWGLREDNPAEGIRIAREKTPSIEGITQKALSSEDALKLWKLVTEKGTARDAALLGLMLWQGLRVAEVVALKAAEIDPTVEKALVILGKGDKTRTVYLVEPAAKTLTAWMQNMKAGQESLFGLSKRSAQRIVDKYFVLAGLKNSGRGAHALRHTYGVLATLGGCARERLADSMGHESINTTDRYIRAAARYQENPAFKMWEFVNGGKNNE